MLSFSGATFSTIREGNAFTVSNSPTSTISSVNYTAASGRGSLTHSFRRSYFTFDVSAITGTVSNLSLNFRTTAAGDSIRVLKSSAFNGSNSNLVSTEFYSGIDFTTTYSNSTTAIIANPFSITLNSTAESDVQNNSWFICAVVNNPHDYTGTASTVAYNKGITVNWSTTPYLEYTEAASGPANVASFLGVTKANISTINTISLGDISEISGVN